MSKATSTGSICKALELYGPSVHVGHDKHGFGKAVFDSGKRSLWDEEEANEVGILWTVSPQSPTGLAIISAIRPAKQGVEKRVPPLEKRLVRKANRLLKAAARLEGLLDGDRSGLSFV